MDSTTIAPTLFLMTTMIDSKLTYAVIWASNNIEKYGYKVFKDFIDKWFNTIAINPNETEILGEICYSKLSDYDWKIDVAIFVLSPKFSLPVLEEIKELGIKKYGSNLVLKVMKLLNFVLETELSMWQMLVLW